ncbi:MAG: hypothetical protein ACAI35_04920 [Candidatus Methylacidiphilales bacterium]
MSNDNVISKISQGAGIAVGFGASLVVGFGAGITMGFGAGLTAGSGLSGSQNIAESVLEKFGYDWVDVLYLFWDPEKQAKAAAVAPIAAAGATASVAAAAGVSRIKESARKRSTKPAEPSVTRAKTETTSLPRAAEQPRTKVTSMTSIFKKRLNANKSALNHRKAA